MTLSLYIARRFLAMFALVFGVFLGILMLIDVIDQLRRHSDSAITTGQAFVLSALNVPESLYQILPLVMILTAIALFLNLARSSELVAVRAAGRSGLRFLLAPVLVAGLLGALAVAVFNPLVAATTKEYRLRSAAMGQDGGSILSISADGLWMRQGGDGGQTVIQANRANPDGSELYDVSFLSFGPDDGLKDRLIAKKARLEPGAWVLDGVKRWPLTAANPEAVAENVVGQLRIATDLTQNRLRDSFGKPNSVAFWKLPSYIAGLERAGFSARSYQVWLQMEFAQPLLLIAMVLIAAGFTMRHARFGKTGSMVLLALLGGFFIFFLRNFAQVLGENGQIPIVLAAWAPPLTAAFMALGLLLHLEDG